MQCQLQEYPTSIILDTNQQMSSKQLPGDNRWMYVKDLTKSLQIDLKANICQHNSLVDQLYSASLHPFAINNSLLEVLSEHCIWDNEQASFRRLPKCATESDIAKWLNMLGQEIEIPYQKQQLHLWSTACHNLPVGGSTTLHKPDIVLIDRSAYEKYHSKTKPSQRIHWSNI
jgi:hypothetical protein